MERNACFLIVISNGKAFEKQREEKRRQEGEGGPKMEGEERDKKGKKSTRREIPPKLGQHH